MEQALTLMNTFAPLTVVAVLGLRNAPPPEHLRSALDILQRRKPLLRARIERGTWGGYRFAPTEQPIPLEVLERQGDGHWQLQAERSLNTRLAASEGPLMACTYLHPEPSGGAGELCFSFHHAAIDAVSGLNLLHELLEVIRDLQDGVPVAAESLEAAASAERYLPPRVTALPRTVGYLWRQLQDAGRVAMAVRGERRAPLHLAARCRLLTVLGFVETLLSRGQPGHGLRLSVRHLEVHGTDVIERRVQPPTVEPPHPPHRRRLHLLPRAPTRRPGVDQLALEQADRALHQRIVIRRAHPTDRTVHAMIEQLLAERQTRILTAGIRMMNHAVSNEPPIGSTPELVQRSRRQRLGLASLLAAAMLLAVHRHLKPAICGRQQASAQRVLCRPAAPSRGPCRQPGSRLLHRNASPDGRPPAYTLPRIRLSPSGAWRGGSTRTSTGRPSEVTSSSPLPPPGRPSKWP